MTMKPSSPNLRTKTMMTSWLYSELRSNIERVALKTNEKVDAVTR